MGESHVPPVCRLVFVEEVLALGSAGEGKSVRVTCRVAEISDEGVRVRVSDCLEPNVGGSESVGGQPAGPFLDVDISTIRCWGVRVGALFQFMGELSLETDTGSNDPPSLPPNRESEEHLILRARVARRVDGLDVRLYAKALKESREFRIAKNMEPL